MLHAIHSLGPIILIVALGAALHRGGFLSRSLLQGMDRLTYWVGIPALLFVKVGTAAVGGGVALRLSVVLILATLGTTLAAIVVAPLVGVPRNGRGPFVQGCFRGNLAFVGLSVVIYGLVPQAGPRGAHVELLAVLALAPMVLLYNLMGVGTLLLSQHHLGWQTIPRLVRPLLTNPLILSCAAGLAYGSSGLPMPPLIERALAALGQMALPLALLSLGGSMLTLRMRGEIGRGVLAGVLKTGLTPLLAWTLGRGLALPPEQMQIALIYAASPTAVISYTLVTQLGGSRALAASAVLGSSFLAILSLAAALSLGPGTAG